MSDNALPAQQTPRAHNPYAHANLVGSGELSTRSHNPYAGGLALVGTDDWVVDDGFAWGVQRAVLGTELAGRADLVSNLGNPTCTRCALNCAACLVACALSVDAATMVQEFIGAFTGRESALVGEPSTFIAALFGLFGDSSNFAQSDVMIEADGCVAADPRVPMDAQYVFCHCERLLVCPGYEVLGVALWKGELMGVGHFVTVVPHKSESVFGQGPHLFVDDASLTWHVTYRSALDTAGGRGFIVHGFLLRKQCGYRPY